MRTMRDILLGVIGAGVVTAVVAVCALLATMFSAGRGDGRREALFGALFFEAVTDASGATTVTVGLDDPMPLVVFVVVAFGVIMLSIGFFHLLRARQLALRADAGHADDA
ncbi:hypothetical protein GCM10009846_07540 [Agrococcus versicolor]|uniref:Uncharacterized protein n=1 Tax=Agrococcus versicolor TaxID=501482 RepID=A0ABN3AKY7_9MICO